MNVNSLGWNLPPDSNPAPVYPSLPPPQQFPTYTPHPVQPATNGGPAIQWLPGSDGSVPPNALIGGRDIDEQPLYIGRARYGGGLIPGKMKPGHKGCYVAHGGTENLIRHYEVLCSVPHEWKESRKGEIPEGALEAGYSETGEKLYIGRIKHKGSLCLGAVHPSYKCLKIPFGGKETSYKAYQIFVPKQQ